MIFNSISKDFFFLSLFVYVFMTINQFTLGKLSVKTPDNFTESNFTLEKRKVGGRPVSISKHPWLVQIINHGDNYLWGCSHSSQLGLDHWGLLEVLQDLSSQCNCRQDVVKYWAPGLGLHSDKREFNFLNVMPYGIVL